MRWSAIGRACAGAAAAALIPTTGALSQAETQGGLRFGIDVSTEVEVARNPDLDPGSDRTEATARVPLRFALESETRTQTFLFAFSGALEAGGEDEREGFVEPLASLRYTRTGARSELSLTADRRVIDVDRNIPFLVDLDGDGVPEFITFDEAEGSAVYTNLGLSLRTGIDRPISHLLTLNLRERQFRDLPSATGVSDSTTRSIGSETTFRINPVTTASLGLSRRETETDDADETLRTTDTISVGLSHAFDETTEVSGRVGYTRVETAQVTGEEVTDGLVLSFDASRALALGEIGFSFELSRNEDGARQTARLRRTLEFPSSRLTVSVGATNSNDETNYVADIAYARTLKTGQITASFSHGITESAVTDEDELLTRLALSYRQEVTELSSVGVSFDVVQRDRTGEDLTQAGLSASYNRALTADWQLSVGYRARFRSDEDGDATSSSVFASVGRSFLWRP